MLFKREIIRLIQTTISKRLKSDNFIISIGILSILPFLVISFFTNPTADDFAYNSKSRDLGFWDAQLFWYYEWSGRYLATAILSVKPLVSDSFLIYKLIPVLLLISLFISLYYLSSLLLVNLKKRDFCIFTFFILAMYLIQMPSVSQGLYWLSGSVTYQLSNILAVLLFCFLIKLIETNERKYLALSIFFTFLVVGLNEASMLLITFLIGVVFIFKYIQKKKFNFSILILLIFAVVFAVIVIKSPGNAIRASTFSNKNQFFYATYKSILAGTSYLGVWLPFIIVFSFIFFDYFGKKTDIKISKIFNVNPIIVCLIVFIIPVIGFFTGYWSTGLNPPSRTINIIYFYFLMGLVYLTFVVFFKLKQKRNDFITYSPSVKYLLFIMIFIQLSQENNIRTAYSDLVSGKAYNYDMELKNRYKIIRNTSKDTILVPMLSFKPRTIYFGDITNDSYDWRNQVYDSYYKPKTIIKIK
jgi:hypothetical protein